jgi:hypothetical protein
LEVRILNSCTESRLSATMGPPLFPVSMSVMPSICTLLLPRRCPLALRVAESPVGVEVVVATTPGARKARPKKLRPLTAMFCTTSPSMA